MNAGRRWPRPWILIVLLGCLVVACGAASSFEPYVLEKNGEFVSVVHSQAFASDIPKARALALSHCARMNRTAMVLTTESYGATGADLFLSWYKCV